MKQIFETRIYRLHAIAHEAILLSFPSVDSPESTPIRGKQSKTFSIYRKKNNTARLKYLSKSNYNHFDESALTIITF